MIQKLVTHNADIRALVEKGYAVASDSNHLVVRDVPYLDEGRELRMGAIVSKLVFTDEVRVKQSDHQVFFAGSVPHGLDGKPIPNLGGGAAEIDLSQACSDVTVQRSFSNKPRPAGKFGDFFEKIESYVGIISGPAAELHGATPLTFRAVEECARSSVFKIHDTLISLAEISDISANFKADVVAIIGLGGTGAYVLDFLAKTPVHEIRGFDGDQYYLHNVFRAPGRFESTDLRKAKAEVCLSRYQNFRNGLTVSCKYIDASCSEDLSGVTFAFVCVDEGNARAGIFELLLAMQIPFIDVGMGLQRRQGPVTGMLRTTYYSAERGSEVRDRNLANLADSIDDVYRANIQLAELNALNASLAVIKFKQLRGFYVEAIPYYHLLFDIADQGTVGES